MSVQTDLGDNLVRALAQTININRPLEPDMIILNLKSAQGSLKLKVENYNVFLGGG